MLNSSSVGGAVSSYATGFTMSGTASIGKNATAANGFITLVPGTSIGGNADASLAITAPLGGIKGTQMAFDPTLNGKTAPPPLNWPIINPGPTSWPIDWNVIQVPGNGYDCTYGDTNDYFFDYNDGVTQDPFQMAISTATQKTVIYAPTCDLAFSRSHTFAMNNDVVVIAKSGTFTQQNSFQSTTSTPHNFSILASPSQTCSPSTTSLNFANQTTFYPPTPGATPGGLNMFLYTPGQVNYGNASTMTGLILGCGGVTGTNAFKLAFSPVAALQIPASGTPLPPNVTVQDKYLSH